MSRWIIDTGDTDWWDRDSDIARLFDVRVYARDLGYLADSAQFAFLPVFETVGPGSRTRMGPKLRPGLALPDCPLAVGTRRNARTLATRTADGLAAVLGEIGLATSIPAWEQLDEMWEWAAEPLQLLDEAMGGSDVLRRLRAVLDDSELRTLIGQPPPLEPLARARRWHGLLSKLDPDTAHRVYLDEALAAVVEGRTAVVGRDLGVWTDAALSIHRASALLHKDSDIGEACWRSFLRCSNSDSFEDVDPQESVRTDCARASRFAARKILRQGPALEARHGAHPLWPTVARLADDRRYDGAEHLAAAAALEERGEAELAWGAIECAAWYAVCLAETSGLPAFQAARALARRQGWEVLTEHLDRVDAEYQAGDG